MYQLYDSVGEPLPRRFSSWLLAHKYRLTMGRPDWEIREKVINPLTIKST